jgi:hypothetical protein
VMNRIFPNRPGSCSRATAASYSIERVDAVDDRPPCRTGCATMARYSRGLPIEGVLATKALREQVIDLMVEAWSGANL